MHELSIARAVVRSVVDALPDPHSRVAGVRLRVGALSGVLPSAVAFAYDVATQGTPLAGSTLQIQTAPVTVRCPACGVQELADLRAFVCPVCGRPCGDVTGGDELEITAVTLRAEPTGTESTPAESIGASEPGSPIAPASTADSPGAELADLDARILAKNDLIAAQLRGRFTGGGVHVSNWVASPGSGKTALLEAVLTTATERGLRAAALVGDCATDNDARRLARSGALVRQIVTDGGCHLEADLVGAHLEGWDLAALDLLAIENVGNLVCPTGFDLGEDTRVALLSVTEGEDKPLKYPLTFRRADVVVITKTDLAGPCEWDRATALEAICRVAPDAFVLETSTRTGAGVPQLLDALLDPRNRLPQVVAPAAAPLGPG